MPVHCIHALVLKKLVDRGLVSEGNVMEQVREITKEMDYLSQIDIETAFELRFRAGLNPNSFDS